ncbi:MAG: phosphotransferase [Deltaproteobacteria bacterium]|jgi:aminoglycoside/choline kinase family phosphotransferase|nr:phosphotransferase [Deltaproteobacteria bacterium]
MLQNANIMTDTLDYALSNALKWAEDFFPGDSPITFSPLDGDGSQRRYIRLFRDNKTIMLLLGPVESENRLWLYLGQKLWYHGLPLPQIFEADLTEGRFLLEDLGHIRLDKVTSDLAWPHCNLARPLAYLLADWHDRALTAVGSLGSSNPPYDQNLAMELEWRYFANGLRLLNLKNAHLADDLSHEALELSCLATSAGDLVLIHRDFQSRNLMLYKDKIEGDKIMVIDWQGARLGPAPYDLSSLLNDPYVNVTEDIKQTFLEHYQSARKSKMPAAFKTQLLSLGALRMMQAFGAYVNLTIVKKKMGYRDYLFPALERLRLILSASPLGHLKGLRNLVDKITMDLSVGQ